MHADWVSLFVVDCFAHLVVRCGRLVRSHMTFHSLKETETDQIWMSAFNNYNMYTERSEKERRTAAKNSLSHN